MNKITNRAGELLAPRTIPGQGKFWLLCFAYSAFMAVLLQKAVLPLWPEMHAGHGLLINDPISYHNAAVKIADVIQSVGWSVWRLYPHGYSGNVGLISAIYATLGPDPAWFIPFNAAAHATAALLIFRLGTRLVPGKVGKIGGLLTAICFLVFPSSLQWYGQNLKDAFSIAGILLILEAWLVVHANPLKLTPRLVIGNLIKTLLGTALLGFVRPHFVGVIAVALFAALLVASVFRAKVSALCTRFGVFAVVALAAVAFTQVGSSIGVYDGVLVAENTIESRIDDTATTEANDTTKPKYFQAKDFKWQESDYLPRFLDSGLRRVSELRAYFVHYGRAVGAGSEIDGDRLPESAPAVIAYMPRALVVGLFAPFPDTWTKRVNLPRLIGAIETACWYLAFLGGIVALYRYRSRRLLAGLVFCAALITIFAYVFPNVGTLYRQRYGVWHFFMLIGIIGWVDLFLSHLPKRLNWNVEATPGSDVPDPHSNLTFGTDHLAKGGAVVILISLANYLGFFTRDLLLIGQFGLGERLDELFSATMIAMFFVTCMAMPLGEAFVVPFVGAGRDTKERQTRLLQGTLQMALWMLIGSMCVAMISAPWLIGLVLNSATAESQAQAVTLVRWFSPIIALSAWTIVGNSALNSLGKPRDSALAQFSVPLVTLTAIMLSPGPMVIAASIAGMLVGTVINALIVTWRLRTMGFTLFPSLTSFNELNEVKKIYKSLVAAAVLPAALIPLNYAFAASVGSGTVAAWAFASKIIVLFSAIASVGATSVVLPKLSHAFEIGGATGVRQDANVLMVLGVWLGSILMVGGVMFAEPLIVALLGKSLPADRIAELTGIIRVGMLQLPVVIIGVLINKLAIAVRRSSQVVYAAALAFAGNVLINVLLVPKIGVMGVAVGALVGVTLSTVWLLLGTYRSIGLSPVEIVIASASWLAWLAVCVGLVSESPAAIAIAIAAVIAMGWVQLSALKADGSLGNGTGSTTAKKILTRLLPKNDQA